MDHLIIVLWAFLPGKDPEIFMASQGEMAVELCESTLPVALAYYNTEGVVLECRPQAPRRPMRRPAP
jgi:hypothetical protein